MDRLARVTAKGQVTIPKSVREALGLRPGDSVMFRVEGDRTSLVRIPNLIDLAGTVKVPPDKRGLSWEEIRDRTRAARYASG